MEDKPLNHWSNICYIVYERRKELGMSQADLANRLHLNQQAISRLEGGTNKPSLAFVTDILDTLGLELVAREQQKADSSASMDVTEQQLLDYAESLTESDSESHQYCPGCSVALYPPCDKHTPCCLCSEESCSSRQPCQKKGGTV